MELGLHPNSAFVCFTWHFSNWIYTHKQWKTVFSCPWKIVFSFQGPQQSLSFEDSFIENMLWDQQRKHQENQTVCSGAYKPAFFAALSSNWGSIANLMHAGTASSLELLFRLLLSLNHCYILFPQPQKLLGEPPSYIDSLSSSEPVQGPFSIEVFINLLIIPNSPSSQFGSGVLRTFNTVLLQFNISMYSHNFSCVLSNQNGNLYEGWSSLFFYKALNNDKGMGVDKYLLWWMDWRDQFFFLAGKCKRV